MIKKCDASQINCPEAETNQPMRVAVNFNGHCRTYCSLTCAQDDISECSEGSDNLNRAANDLDIFILSAHPHQDTQTLWYKK